MYLLASAKTILSVDNKNSSTSHVINYEKNQLGLENSQISYPFTEQALNVDRRAHFAVLKKPRYGYCI